MSKKSRWSQDSDWSQNSQWQSGRWVYLPGPEPPPAEEIVEGNKCAAESGFHPFVFKATRLKDEKYRFYGACAEGCVKCVIGFLDGKPTDWVQALSDSKAYSAADFAIFELLKDGPRKMALAKVIELLEAHEVTPNFYEKDGESWKEK